MLDRLHFFVPFAPQFVTIERMDSTREGKGDICSVDLKALDVRLVGSITYEPNGSPLVEDLRHPYESVPSSFTGMALKVFPRTYGKRVSPGIELKASPAKLLQGHNVFGPSCIELGFTTMVDLLARAYPHLVSMLDFRCAVLISLDATYSSRLANESTCLQAMQAIQGVSSGQTKARGDNYATTSYFGSKTSRTKRLKLYLKWQEYCAQIKSLEAERTPEAKRTLAVMLDPALQEWAKNLMRLEVTILKRFLEARDISHNMIMLIQKQREFDTPDAFLQYLWTESTADLFKAFEGQTMKVITDEAVKKHLLSNFTTYTAAGKARETMPLSAFRTYRMIRDYGYDEAMVSMSRATFYRHVSMIADCGISKATLQKLNDSQQSNVVPLLRFVTIDFSSQRPSWYVEPRLIA
jgi:II/X family phage/plasmid replication protein